MKYYLDPREGNDGKNSIIIRGRYNSGKQYRIFVTSVFKEARIEADNWKQKDQKVKGNPKLGETLKKIKSVLERHVMDKKVLDAGYDIPEAWRDLYLKVTRAGKTEPTFPEKVLAAIPIYKEYFKGKKSPGYLRILDQLDADLKAWNPDIIFSKLNYLTLESFKSYLTGKDGKRAKVLESATVCSRFKYLRELSTLAGRHGVTVDQSIYDFKVKYVHRSGGFALTYPELMKIYHYESDNKTRMIARDYFLCEAFTGIRNSDCQSLRNGNINPDFIEYTDQKNDSKLKTVTRHKLNNYIIKKYHNSDKPNEFLLPSLAQQTINEELKIIARDLNLDRVIHRKGELKPVHRCLSTHCGRHTYTTLLNMLGIAADYIKEEIGHSQGLTFGTYTHRYDRYEIIKEGINSLPIDVSPDVHVTKLRKVV